MAKRLSRYFLGVFLSFVSFFSFTSRAFAQSIWKDYCTGPEAIDATDVATIRGFECLVYNILQIAISLIGVAVLIMLLIGGFKLLTSGGDPKGVAAGKQTITYALMGLVLAISAWFILNLIAYLTGADILFFDIFLD